MGGWHTVSFRSVFSQPFGSSANDGANAKCVRLDHLDGKWGDKPCSSGYWAVCEKKIYVTTTTSMTTTTPTPTPTLAPTPTSTTAPFISECKF